ncbi:choline TMA-lyase-activating enzyme [Pectobacterium atrosepticum]|uniref:choline TMA-lyase-activating enzyme n=1 Tax=Pectobacterium TaxID=122277 RepID=UPI0003A36352|nr:MULTISPECIES: choline TMA-lyase-activating enzyme [Pectobacterium]GKV86858.1 choline trimethylamine-lyase activating enzyme [Pectobacterium carotovorum subsp. carotovorum]ATY92235.1 choline TMA-lyase-activating enzyme [Pectobacterium atrosepticum]KFX14485.1 glycyl radical-activating protein [Pectobacterium atrosepticum]MBL0894153.1 choline TMA-lyase-activating enzyme [Pectobacterium atrosepticum]MCA6978254.1 choline TMA-lyase-activating enzyme [Pectobacterium atrosepticum]
MEPAKDITGRIFNIQKYSIYDGDGVRTLIFMKGCNIRCPWCANPEGIRRAYQILFSPDKCLHCGKCAEAYPRGIHTLIADECGSRFHHIDRTVQCTGCRKCEVACPSNALDIVGKDMTVAELMAVIMQDYSFYQSSGGGVTLSGGEVSLQTDFAVALLQACKQKMINTAVETQGTTSISHYDQLAAVTDMFLFDIKHIDTNQHKALFGIGNENIRRNLEHLVELGANIVIRMPLVRGYNDSYDAIMGAIHYVKKLAKRGNVRRIDILPYHQLGRKKYERLGMIYPIKADPSYNEEELNRLDAFFDEFDFDIQLVRH